jgi:hypothetical protein
MREPMVPAAARKRKLPAGERLKKKRERSRRLLSRFSDDFSFETQPHDGQEAFETRMEKKTRRKREALMSVRFQFVFLPANDAIERRKKKLALLQPPPTSPPAAEK